MASQAFSFPLRTGKMEEWRTWIREVLGPGRSEYEGFSRRVGLKTTRCYLQHTPQGDQAIIYLEGNDLPRLFHELQTSADPFVVWLRQHTLDVFDGVDLTQIDLRSLPQYVFEGPSLEEDEVSHDARMQMEQLGMISP
jgi:hypothetical protein